MRIAAALLAASLGVAPVLGCAFSPASDESAAPIGDGPDVVRTGTPASADDLRHESLLTGSHAFIPLGKGSSYAGYDRAAQAARIAAVSQGKVLGIAVGPVASASGTNVICGGVRTSLFSDPDNCGSCGHSCRGGTCDAGRCEVATIASGIAGLSSIAVSAGKIAFAAADEIVAQTGQERTAHVVAQSKSAMGAFALTESGVFFLTADGGIFYSDFASTETRQLFATTDENRALALDGATLLWVGRDANGDDRIFQGRAGDASPTLIVDVGMQLRGVAFDSGHVYYTTVDGRVVRASRTPNCQGSSCIETIASGEAFAAAIAVNASTLFWSRDADRSLRAASLDEPVARLVSRGIDAIDQLVASDEGVYYAAHREGVIGVLAFVGNESDSPVYVGAHVDGGDVTSFRSDENCLYWSSVKTGSIYRLAK